MNFYFKTLGCKVNQYETQAMKEALIKLGHTANIGSPPDAVVINSCTVTAESDRKTRQILRQLKRQYENAVIVLTGCMVQAFPEKAKLLDDADIIIGNRDVTAVVNAINTYNNGKIFEICSHEPDDNYVSLPISDFSERTRAFMKIEDGCNRYCTYCIIPKARGYVRSRPLEDIKKEAEALAKNGYLEIVLVGINLSAYGQGTEYNIGDAVNAVSSVEGIKRVRLGSLEPDHITDDILLRLKNNKKFCEQFHLSLQSGCDETLKRMNRHYDTAFYYDLVTRIRNIFPNAAITTDIMVGFPDESKEEFNKSIDFVKKVGFARSHIFAYSRRGGTVADGLPNQISNHIKQQRAKIMADVTANSEKEFLASQSGKVLPVLFETSKSGLQTGYTGNYLKVCINTATNLTGQILPVRITRTFNSFCSGEIVNKE